MIRVPPWWRDLAPASSASRNTNSSTNFYHNCCESENCCICFRNRYWLSNIKKNKYNCFRPGVFFIRNAWKLYIESCLDVIFHSFVNLMVTSFFSSEILKWRGFNLVYVSFFAVKFSPSWNIFYNSWWFWNLNFRYSQKIFLLLLRPYSVTTPFKHKRLELVLLSHMIGWSSVYPRELCSKEVV